MQKTKSGFTIVEIIIVIVIIAIVASLATVAYRGAQDRAKNAQTITAATQWLNALQLYKTRNGGYPNTVSCLGANYNYNVDNLGASGVGQCRQDTSTYGIKTDPIFYAAMEKYVTSNPTPAMITGINTATSWYRGLYYYIGAGNTARLDMVLTLTSGGCPDRLAGILLNSGGITSDGNYLCTYAIGKTIGYQ
jgi:general secretion pathway protein G